MSAKLFSTIAVLLAALFPVGTQAANKLENPTSSDYTKSTLSHEQLNTLIAKASAGDVQAAHELGRFYLYDKITCAEDALSGRKRISEEKFDSLTSDQMDVDNLMFACNPREAIHWLEVANGSFNPTAMNDLGVAYDETGSEKKALGWYIKAATAGSVEGQTNLAVALLVGRHVPMNWTQGLFWSRVAGDSGFEGKWNGLYGRMSKRAKAKDIREAAKMYDAYKSTGQIPKSAIPDSPAID